ncbi:DUF6064 family protein [Aestuariivirga sp.]|uniref:DUF6064 family protein n=1 Tax=Aestuariivirga sp. TaxID=2650926 RepID=UPI00391C0224
MPFSVEEFFRVFADYNAAIWPLQVVAHVIGLAILALQRFPSRGSDMAIMLFLSAMWALNGIAYHLMHFSAINPAARLFAMLFIAQAALLFAAPFIWRGIVTPARRGAMAAVGLALALFALAGYPLVGLMAGHSYPAVPVFGVAPCPTAIFTIGILLTGEQRAVRWLLIVPVIWSVIGGSAAVLLNVPQDYALVLAGLAGLALLARSFTHQEVGPREN